MDPVAIKGVAGSNRDARSVHYSKPPKPFLSCWSAARNVIHHRGWRTACVVFRRRTTPGLWPSGSRLFLVGLLFLLSCVSANVFFFSFFFSEMHNLLGLQGKTLIIQINSFFRSFVRLIINLFGQTLTPTFVKTRNKKTFLRLKLLYLAPRVESESTTLLTPCKKKKLISLSRARR